MENDKHFKTLMEAGTQKASADFTAHVMDDIRRKAVPVINHKLKRIYKLTVMLTACLLIALSFLNKPFEQLVNTYLKFPDLSPKMVVWIASYIFSFWILIIINYRLQGKKYHDSPAHNAEGG